jgi:hypothetical protein
LGSEDEADGAASGVTKWDGWGSVSLGGNGLESDGAGGVGVRAGVGVGVGMGGRGILKRRSTVATRGE